MSDSSNPTPEPNLTNWRDSVKTDASQRQMHSLPEVILLVLDMAAEDAEASDSEVGGSARTDFREMTGFDIYDWLRGTMNAVQAAHLDATGAPDAG